jgi:protein required for attachment to host cells
MVHLTLTGLSEDGRKLLLVSDAGAEFTADVDARLRAALNARPDGDQARPGQLEMQMDSTLRPRDSSPARRSTR